MFLFLVLFLGCGDFFDFVFIDMVALDTSILDEGSLLGDEGLILDEGLLFTSVLVTFTYIVIMEMVKGIY